MPKIFRITPGIFRGDTINTPSMLCVADALDGLRWAERQGGLPGLIARAEANLAAHRRPGRQATPWASFLAADPAQRSPTSICLRVDGRRAADGAEAAGRGRRRVRHRQLPRRPAGLRIWGGATVETADIDALLPWLDWAHTASFCPVSAMV